uniref:Protein NRT1/ PTR FAMILY 5.6-like n=1 Tax=Nicotiana tabacum TaxID=4097 RepID=A0A1S4BIP6_TOBAC|nr:PREDICTED: protein NRT1/ PTR FAMILY 5.6-like [Nicotiana tabacum]
MNACVSIKFTLSKIVLSFGQGLGMLWYETHRLSIKALFGALALLTLGKAGRDVTLKAFLADQLWRSNEETNEENENLIETRQEIIWSVCWILGIIIATVWLSNTEWEVLAKISTIAMVAGFSLFLLGIPFYERKKPSPSPILDVFKVVKAALSKIHLDYPVSPSQLFMNNTSDTKILPNIALLRWLDKAAILEPSPPCPVAIEQAETADIFEVAKVNLVGATANTFFYEQANVMDDHLGKISHVPIVIFVIIKTFTSSIISIICQSLKNAVRTTRSPPLFRTILGMFCSFLCCLAAWWVEKYRHDDMEIWVDEDNVEFYVNEMSVFWLIPQFVLVGLMDGLSSSGLKDIFETKVSDSMKGYEPEFTEFITGIGKFFSVIFILIFGSWFKEDVNTSRLDKYYAMLMAPTFLNFLFCWFVCSWYAHQPYFHITIDSAQQSEAGTIEVLTNENSGFDTAQKFEDGVVEVLTNENSSFDNAQELEDGIIEILITENSSLTPSTNN